MRGTTINLVVGCIGILGKKDFACRGALSYNKGRLYYK
jgi:hypothetical protein